MRAIRLIVLFAAAALICGCAASSQDSYAGGNNRPCDWAARQSTTGHSFSGVALFFALTVYCSYTGQWDARNQSGGSSPAVVPEPSAPPIERYAAKDGAFSVDAPYVRGTDAHKYMQVSDESSFAGDYVVFSSAVEPGSIYAVMTFKPESGRSQLSSSLEDFARSFVAEQRRQGRKAGVTDLQQTYAQTIKLDGQQVLFQAYRIVVAAPEPAPSAGGQRPVYYLMYFFRTLNGRGVIWIVHPGSCPACATGPESAIRSSSPAITRFVGSFATPS